MISSSDDEYESAMEKENEPPVATVDHVHVKAASRLRYVQSKIQFGYMSYFQNFGKIGFLTVYLSFTFVYKISRVNRK